MSAFLPKWSFGHWRGFDGLIFKPQMLRPLNAGRHFAPGGRRSQTTVAYVLQARGISIRACLRGSLEIDLKLSVQGTESPLLDQTTLAGPIAFLRQMSLGAPAVLLPEKESS